MHATAQGRTIVWSLAALLLVANVSGYAVDLYAALDKNGIAVAIPSSRRMGATIRRGACHLMNPGHRVPATPTPGATVTPSGKVLYPPATT